MPTLTATITDEVSTLPRVDESLIQVSIEQQEKNQSLFRSHHVDQCFSCGRPMTESGLERAWFIHLSTNGGIFHNDEPAEVTNRTSQGSYPLGSECAKQVPASHKMRMSA